MRIFRDPDRLKRRSVRLRDRDYSAPGAYAVTICTHERACWLAEVDERGAVTTDFGQIVADYLLSLSAWFRHARVAAFVIMPNHVHAIIVIREATIRHAEGAAADSHGTRSGSVAAIVQNLKAVCARRINAARGTPGAPVWQRNYHERVLRESEVDRARAYIAANPSRWASDAHNPAMAKDDG
jgi:putative transposase